MTVSTNGQSATDTLISPFAGRIAQPEADEATPALESPFAALVAESPSFADMLGEGAEDAHEANAHEVDAQGTEFEYAEPEFGSDEAELDEAEQFESPTWTGSAEQLQFRERVLAAHLAHTRKRRGAPLRDLSTDEAKRLVTIPGTNVTTFPDTAAAAGRLLRAAHADLATAKRAGNADALRTIGLGVNSGYRGSQRQRELWLGYFKDYYNQTRVARASLPDGPHSQRAVEYMLDPGGFGLRGKIAAPGYSNHQNGIAIDFRQDRTAGHAVRNSTTSRARKAWRDSWFHHWLGQNAELFGFQSIPTEEWHWEYRKGASSSREDEFEVSGSFDDEDGAAGDYPASRLQWPGRSAEELAFMRAVYDRQGAKSTGTYTADLPQVATIEGRHTARPDAAAAAREMLAQARVDLAAAGLADRVTIGIVSAYRSAGDQFVIWQGKGRSGGFPYYYKEMLDSGRLRRGDFGPTAVAKMATEMAKWIAAPGFSNHQDGLAIDFGTGDRRHGGLGKIGAKSWFHKWLTTHARHFGFHPYQAEAWHWTYRRPVGAEAWEDETASGAISAGEIKVQSVPLLSAHRGTRPSYDLVLGWNTMSAIPEAIDVVVHLHGYWYPRPKVLDDIRPVSGVDLSPTQSAQRRSRPTLTVLPRGHDTGVTQKYKQKDGTYKYGYNKFTFPRIVTKDGLDSLIRFALERFAKQVGGPPPRVGRLILTAHSGGGAALLKILEHTDPHQVHVFDALYQDAGTLATWARNRIARDRQALQALGTQSADEYMRTQGGALRVFYQGRVRGGTRPHSLRLRDQLAGHLGDLARWYRVEASNYDHFAIPRNYGWRLLIDASADMPDAQAERAVAREDEWDEGSHTGSDEFETFEDVTEAEDVGYVDELDDGEFVDMREEEGADEGGAGEWEVDDAGEWEVDSPNVALGSLVVRTATRTWSYQFTAEDLVWTAKLLVHEAGGEDNVDNAAVLWAMFNRYALFTYDDYLSFSSFIRAYSTTLQPVLRNPQAAARHMHRPPSEFVRTGGTYPGTDIPRGQLKRHLDIQKAPWGAVKLSARQLATRALTGRLANPGIGLSTQFASTRVYFRQKHGRYPSTAEWRQYTLAFAGAKKWKWIGEVAQLNQLKNAFFIQRPAIGLPAGAVRVLAPGAAGEAFEDTEWEHQYEDMFEAGELFDDEAELESVAAALTRALRSEWPTIRAGLLRGHQRNDGEFGDYR